MFSLENQLSMSVRFCKAVLISFLTPFSFFFLALIIGTLSGILTVMAYGWVVESYSMTFLARVFSPCFEICLGGFFIIISRAFFNRVCVSVMPSFAGEEKPLPWLEYVTGIAESQPDEESGISPTITTGLAGKEMAGAHWHDWPVWLDTTCLGGMYDW